MLTFIMIRKYSLFFFIWPKRRGKIQKSVSEALPLTVELKPAGSSSNSLHSRQPQQPLSS